MLAAKSTRVVLIWISPAFSTVITNDVGILDRKENLLTKLTLFGTRRRECYVANDLATEANSPQFVYLQEGVTAEFAGTGS